MASSLLNNGRDDTTERRCSLEPSDLGTSSCSYESELSPSRDHPCTLQQGNSLEDRQRLALELVEQSSVWQEDYLSELTTMAAIQADLKGEMSAPSGWVAEACPQFSTEDFDDRHRDSFSGNCFIGRTAARTRECNGRLSFVAPQDHQRLNMSSVLKFRRGRLSKHVSTEPLKSLGNKFTNSLSHQQQQQLLLSHYHEQQQLESIQQLQKFQIPGQFSSFDDTTVTKSLSSFGSSSGDQSEDSIIIDQMDRAMSLPSEKRQRLMSSSPVHHSPSMIHHSSVDFGSILRDTLQPSSRLDDGAVESTVTNMTHQERASRVAALGIGVNVEGINEMLSGRCNPTQPPPLTCLQQRQLQSSFPVMGNSNNMPAPRELGTGPIHITPSPLFAKLARISPGLSLKGLSRLGASHEANTMEQLLVHCAQALEKMDVNSAHQVMWVLNNTVSAEGDPNERVTSCFLKALVSRAGRMAPSFNAMYGEERVSKTVSAVEYAVMVDITPWYRFGFQAANGAMLEAFEGKERVHIIDFTTTYGMQWPTLIEALSVRPEGPPHVRLTVHNARPNVAPYLDMSEEEVIRRLILFATTKNVELEVAVILREIELLDHSMFGIRDDEVTIANCMYRARFIPDESAESTGSGHCSSRDDFFKMVHSLNPSLVTIVDEEANVTSPSLVTRLKAAFNYLWIPFDTLDTFLPRDSPQRLEYELILAKKIENIIAREGLDRIERMETKEKWGQRLKKAGFELVPFSEDVSEEVKIMLSDHAAGWGMKQDEDAMLLTWKGHNALFATVWRPSSRPWITG